MKGKVNSIWNIQVVEILLAELKKKDWDGLPQRSEAYLGNLIGRKLETPVMLIEDNFDAVDRNRETAEQVAVKWGFQNKR